MDYALDSVSTTVIRAWFYLGMIIQPQMIRHHPEPDINREALRRMIGLGRLR